MKKMKRLLALVLALAMALSVAVTTSFATEVPAADSTLTITEANTLGVAQGKGNYTEGKYYVTGVIKSIASTTWGNMYIEDENGETLYVYGLYSADGTVRYDAMDSQPGVGDTITVYGVIGTFNGTEAQMKNGWATEVIDGEAPENTDPPADTSLTIDKAVELGLSKDKNTYTEGKYYVTGTVTKIVNSTYGNLYIEDEDGNSLYVYGAYTAYGVTRFDKMTTPPAVGDTITVYGIIGTYNGNEAQMKNGWIRNEEYVISDTVLTAGDNTIKDNQYAQYTIYEFVPAETGVYSFTIATSDSYAKNPAVAIWGGSLVSGFVYAIEGNNTFTCTEAGAQSAIVAVSGTDNYTVTITKTGEYNPIVWTDYTNAHTPDEANTLCYKLDEGSDIVADELVQDGDFYYTADGKPVFVNFNYANMSIAAMLSYGNVRVVKGEEYIDYTAAMTAYNECGIYPLTDDLKQMLSDVAAYNNWAGFEVAWTDLCATATQIHSYVDGTCSVCDAGPIDLTFDLLYEDDFSATVTVPAGQTYYFCAYRVGGMIMTINGGEGVACTTDGMWSPYTWTITNDGDADAEYVITVGFPVGAQGNPAELNIVDWNGNTATVNGSEY